MADEQNGDVTRALSTFGAPPITYRTFGAVTVQPIPLASPPAEATVAVPLQEAFPPEPAVATPEPEAIVPAALPAHAAAPLPEVPARSWSSMPAGDVATLPFRVAVQPTAFVAQVDHGGPRRPAFSPSIFTAPRQPSAPAVPAPAPAAAEPVRRTFPMPVQPAVPMPPSGTGRTDGPEQATELRDLFRFLAEGSRTADILPQSMTLPGIFQRL
jgi:hypothetical protein